MTAYLAGERLRVNVIVPLFNEEDSLPLLCSCLKQLQARLAATYDVNYIFVDDGSTDQTVALLKQLLPPVCVSRVISHGRNKGLGAALQTGFRASQAVDIVCTIDADCTYSPEHLPNMIKQVVPGGGSDIVVASPYHPQGQVDGVQPWRLQLSKGCSALYRIVSPLKLHTYTSLFRVYSGTFCRESLKHRDDFISLVELLLIAFARGYRIAEIPLTLRRRAAGVSKMRVASTIGSHVTLMTRCLFSPSFRQAASSRTRASGQAEAPMPDQSSRKVGAL